MILFFFFKQKTAYEMRISDWSSDVCSSDLSGSAPRGARSPNGCAPQWSNTSSASIWSPCRPTRRARRATSWIGSTRICAATSRMSPRSEEHTSELQSLMRISYAVFCLKKKNKKNTTHQYIYIMKDTLDNNKKIQFV